MSDTGRVVYYAKNITVDLGTRGEWEQKERRPRPGWLTDRYREHLVTDWVRLEPGGDARPQPRILTRARCSYCGGQLIFYGQPNNEPFAGDQTFAGECQSCGWWFCESQH